MAKLTIRQIDNVKKSFKILVSFVNKYGLCNGELRNPFMEYKLSVSRFLAYPNDYESLKNIISAFYWIETYNKIIYEIIGSELTSEKNKVSLKTVIDGVKSSLFAILEVYYRDLPVNQSFDKAIVLIYKKHELLTVEDFMEELADMFMISH